MRYSYQSKCFSEARRALMLPFHSGEAASIAHAFHLCSRALEELRLDRSKLDNEDVLQWIDIVEKAMGTDGVEDPLGEGTWLVKARLLSIEEQAEFSRAVAGLADWFDMQFWGSSKQG